MKSYYEYAKERYAAEGIDTEAAIQTLSDLTLSVHCWQGDDVIGFDNKDSLSGGIQTTGNYPGKATTPAELMADFDQVLALTAGKKKLNLHASYAIFEEGEFADRDALEPKHFSKWVEYAKERGLGIDFNPTYFSHPKAAGLTLSSPDEEIRSFWVRHTVACLKIAAYFADETGVPCVMNIWIPDGYKDIPADRTSPRTRFAKSLDEALSSGYDKTKVYVTLESKVFGIGLESYTVGSAEFCQNYAATRRIVPLMDNGHYHPTEMVSDKISSLLLFHDKLALHITRPVRWDSDHVVRFDDETREIAKEIVASGRLGDVVLALDYFDASINRVAAWILGIRSTQKALLEALLTPHAALSVLQKEEDFTRLFMRQEALKTLPLGAVWEEFCRRAGLPQGEGWYDIVMDYEKKILQERG